MKYPDWSNARTIISGSGTVTVSEDGFANIDARGIGTRAAGVYLNGHLIANSQGSPYGTDDDINFVLIKKGDILSVGHGSCYVVFIPFKR